jgi:FAD/FMN-containing dehydrogenase
VWWKLVAFERKHRWKARYDRRKGRPDREDVIQDVEVPIEALEQFMGFFEREIPIEPVWFCPMKQRSADDVWELYRFDPSKLYVNVGFWSSVALEPGEDPSTHNRLIEAEVDALGGRKSLYSTAFYERDHFWELYNGPVYELLKKRWDPDARLLDLYEKTVQGR